ncbi:MAG: hypothetical protein ACOCV4_00350 [Myxococcota bacterium]
MAFRPSFVGFGAASEPRNTTIHRCSNLFGALVLLVTLAGCGDEGEDASLPPIEPTYANVEMIMERSCTFGSCHGGSGSGKGDLNLEPLLDAGEPITDALVDVPSCEYPLMPRIDPGDPDNSWLWIKMSPEYMAEDGTIDFTPDPSFDPGEAPCSDLGFGINMPFAMGDPSPLADNELTAIREWIEMGAPGPSEPPPDGGTDGGVADAAADN